VLSLLEVVQLEQHQPVDLPNCMQGVGLRREGCPWCTLNERVTETRKRGRIGMLYQSCFAWGCCFPRLVTLSDPRSETVGHGSEWPVVFATAVSPSVWDLRHGCR